MAKWEFNFDDENILNWLDSQPAKVIDGTKKGVFIEFDNGDRAFAPYGSLPAGTQVLATIKRPADRVNYFNHLASIDSVLYAAA